MGLSHNYSVTLANIMFVNFGHIDTRDKDYERAPKYIPCGWGLVYFGECLMSKYSQSDLSDFGLYCKVESKSKSLF